ncbi:MAG: Bax inhibitor-1/YccA family protein [Firmicutes bacterium]|nr:Bax inhibitor-1/YccA family protein [Bacillota bacterium]
MRFRGSNPVYSRMGDFSGSSDVSASYGGVAAKTGILLAITAVVALYFGSTLDLEVSFMTVITTIIISPIVAIIMVILAHKNTEMAWIYSLVYATCEGLFLGFISALFAWNFGQDIVYMALLATFGVLSGMLFLYSTGIIRVGNYFRRFLFSALIGLIFASLIFFILAMFGAMDTTAGYSLYIMIVLVSVVISSLYLLVDFDNVTRLVNNGAGKEYEWTLALGLVVTIVWLYIEMLRLIAILYGRKK